MKFLKRTSALFLCLLVHIPANADAERHAIDEIVSDTIQPMMRDYGIPGMSVAITLNGQSSVYNYGVASKTTQQPVTDNTIFEIGSISKTLTATLAALADVEGDLALTDSVSTYLPALKGSHFDDTSLLNLGTHTVGDLPLQVPGDIDDIEQLMDYLKDWKSSYRAGTVRQYSNLSIGLLGLIAADSMNEAFEDAIGTRIFAKLDMLNSYYDVPASKMGHYAQGYDKDDQPVRASPGVLDMQAYGVKTSALDLLKLVEANMGLVDVDSDLQQAIDMTRKGYYRIGDMTQDLIWEQYSYPLERDRLVAGNSYDMIFDANKAARITPALEPQSDVIVNKTGSTNGFGGYAVFAPEKKIGIVMLANKNYPNEARVTAAYRIITQLDKQATSTTSH